MFARLLNNIAITAVAYSVISGVGLLLAPFLIATYGLAGYGQILLARIFLPSAFFGLLDMGIGETATRSVAQAQTTGDWEDGAATLSLLVVVAMVIGIVLGGAIAILAPQVTGWLGIAGASAEGFILVLRLTAAILPLMFLSLVAEGVLKGFQSFAVLRTCEIVAALLQGGFAVVLGLRGYGPNWIAASLLIALSVRFVMVSTAAMKQLRQRGATMRLWSAREREEVARWSGVMLRSKVLGTVQHQIASPIIGLVFGPAAVGAYDAVVRLPRFAKTAFSLISTTVLPTAAGLKVSGNDAELARLGYYGIVGAVLICAPVAIVALVFSEPILRAWIGPQFGEFWPWQSAMFVVALLNVPISFGGAILLAERGASQKLLRLTTIQVVLQLVGALTLLSTLEQWSFVLAQTISVMLIFPFQLVLVQRALGIQRPLIRNVAVISGVSLALAIAAAALHEPGSFIELALQAGLVVAIIAGVVPWLILDRDERASVASFAKRLRNKSVDAQPKVD